MVDALICASSLHRLASTTMHFAVTCALTRLSNTDALFVKCCCCKCKLCDTHCVCFEAERNLKMKAASEVVIKVSALMMGLPDKVGGNVVEKKAFAEVLSKMGIQVYAVQTSR